MMDMTEAKRYVLQELMDLMDKKEREKLSSSFKPDSIPTEEETKTRETDMHDDLAGKMLSGEMDKEHELAEGVTETPLSTGSSSDNDEDDKPVRIDMVNMYAKKYKK